MHKSSVLRLLEDVRGVESAAEAGVGGDLGEQLGAVHLPTGQVAGAEQGEGGQAGLGRAGRAGVPQQPEQRRVDQGEAGEILTGDIPLVLNYPRLLLRSPGVEKYVDERRIFCFSLAS